MGKHDQRRFDAKASSKGQVTIPVEVRQLIGLAPGGSVQFIAEGGGQVRIIAKKRGLHHLKGLLGPIDAPVDVEAAIAEAMDARTDPNRREVGP